jgi:hypothetical protein
VDKQQHAGSPTDAGHPTSRMRVVKKKISFLGISFRSPLAAIAGQVRYQAPKLVNNNDSVRSDGQSKG